MKMTRIVAALLAGASLAFGGDRVPEPTKLDSPYGGLDSLVPRKFRVGGTEYAFDESFFLEGFRYDLDRYESIQHLPDSDNNKDRVLREIAYYVISAGIFVQKSAGLQELLDRTQRLLGDKPVPAGVVSPVAAGVACASLSFKNREGDPVDVDIIDFAPGDYHNLLLISRMQLDARSAAKSGNSGQ